MNRNNFFAFISSKDENDILTVKYETKNKETVTEQFKHMKKRRDFFHSQRIPEIRTPLSYCQVQRNDFL